MILCNNRLPEDVVIDILSQLPAESLMRFKCVRKSWYALIQDSEFVAMQLRNHYSRREKEPTIFLALKQSIDPPIIFGPQKDQFLSMLKYDGRQVVPSHATDVNLSVYNNPGSICGPVSICGPCDGIVCFYDFVDCVIVANPGIRQYRALPKSSIPPPPKVESWWEDAEGHLCKDTIEYSPRTFDLGLGIDLQAKDYKLVRILEFVDIYEDPAPKYKGSRYDVEVYSFGSNSWRQIGDAYYLNCLIIGYESSYWNGAYYWCARGWDEGDNMYGLCSFNFTDEEFQFIPFPSYLLLLSKGRSGNYMITEFNGALSLITYHDDLEMAYCFDIWVMDVHGGTTWTKLLSSNKPQLLDGHVVTPLGVLKNDQLLLWLSNQQLAYYSFVTNESKILPIDSDDNDYSYNICIIDYKTSLVLINRGEDNDG